MAEPKRFNGRRADAEPHVFVLEYVETQPDGTTADREAEFTAVAVGSPGAILRFTELVEPETGARPAKALLDFMREVLVPDDVPRWDALISAQSTLVDVATIGEIVGWLVEAYTNRPTLPR